MDRNRPTWATVVAAVCLVGLVALGWIVQHLWTAVEIERTYRENTRGKLIQLLTLVEHSQCDDIEDLREAVQRMREDIQDKKE